MLKRRISLKLSDILVAFNVNDCQEGQAVIIFESIVYGRNTSYILNCQLCDADEIKQVVMEAPSGNCLVFILLVTIMVWTGVTYWPSTEPSIKKHVHPVEDIGISPWPVDVVEFGADAYAHRKQLYIKQLYN